MNSPLLQRLRRIRQLALAELVYPGARHSRFEHSVGTMHLAGRLAEQTGLGEDEVRLVRLAGLLHDVGHGPFSHVSEECLRVSAGSRFPSSEGAIHEVLGALMVQSSAELAFLGDETRRAVLAMISHGRARSLTTDIVSGPIDADRLDYLLRDSHFAGVNYGAYDLEWIVSNAVAIGKNENLGFDERAVWAIEQMLLAVHHMTTQVYTHRVRVATDSMLVRGVILAIRDDDRIRQLFDLSDANMDTFVAQWCELDDQCLFDAIVQSDSMPARSLFIRLRERRFLKLALRVNLADDIGGVHQRTRLWHLTEGERETLESQLAKYLGVKPWEVLIVQRRTRDPLPESGKIEIDHESILIRFRNGRVDNLTRHPDFSLERPKPRQQLLEIYAALPERPGEAVARDLMARLAEWGDQT